MPRLSKERRLEKAMQDAPKVTIEVFGANFTSIVDSAYMEAIKYFGAPDEDHFFAHHPFHANPHIVDVKNHVQQYKAHVNVALVSNKAIEIPGDEEDDDEDGLDED